MGVSTHAIQSIRQNRALQHSNSDRFIKLKTVVNALKIDEQNALSDRFAEGKSTSYRQGVAEAIRRRRVRYLGLMFMAISVTVAATVFICWMVLSHYGEM